MGICQHIHSVRFPRLSLPDKNGKEQECATIMRTGMYSLFPFMRLTINVASKRIISRII